MASFLQELQRLEQEALLLNVIGLCHGQSHVEKRVLVRVLIVFSFKDLLIREYLRLGWRELTSLLQGLLKVLERSLVLRQRLALGKIHLLCEFSREIFCQVPWGIFGEVDALCYQQILSLSLHDCHLLAKFHLTPVKVHEDVDVEGVDDLVGFAEELLALQRSSASVFATPFGHIDASLKQIFISQLLFACLDL